MVILVFLLLLLCLAFILSGYIPWTKLGKIGTHIENIGQYQIEVPFGWRKVPPINFDEFKVEKFSEQDFQSIYLKDGSSGKLLITIESPKLVAENTARYKETYGHEPTFPEMTFGYKPTISPVSELIINGISFKKVSWTVTEIDLIPPEFRSIVQGPITKETALMGFEYRSQLIDGKQIINFKGDSLNIRSLEHAEQIVLTLRKIQDK